jgi:hypothetical protein
MAMADRPHKPKPAKTEPRVFLTVDDNPAYIVEMPGENDESPAPKPAPSPPSDREDGHDERDEPDRH